MRRNIEARAWDSGRAAKVASTIGAVLLCLRVAAAGQDELSAARLREIARAASAELARGQQSAAADTEARAILDLAREITQAQSRVQEIQRPIDDVALNLDRPGASARGAVPGWQRSLATVRRQAAQLRARHAALRVDAVSREPGRGAAMALRVHGELGARLQRLDEAIGRLARSIENVQALSKEPEPPSAPPALAPERAASPGAAESPRVGPENANLSGTWRVGAKEWTITHNPNGTIVLQRPHTLPDGRFDEYRGTIVGRTVTLSHQVTPLTSTSKPVPAKLLQEWGSKGLTKTLTCG